MQRDITKLTKRNAELESAINDIRNAWAHYHSVGGAVSRQEWLYAIHETNKVIRKVWRLTR